MGAAVRGQPPAPGEPLLSYRGHPADRAFAAALRRRDLPGRILAGSSRDVRARLGAPVPGARLRRKAARILPRLALPPRRAAVVDRQDPRPRLSGSGATRALAW